MSSEILILGKKGFLASHLISFFFKKKISFLSLGSDDIDLTTEKSAKKLASIKKKYSIIFCSAITPDKGKDEFCYLKNVNMIVNFFKFFKKENISHFYYISSDAVYNLKNEVINEVTQVDPGDLYGLMHLTREKIIQTHLPTDKITILRPTGVYGKGDTHSSYGPNRFIKTALKNNEILLFGSGKDQRNHLFIDDLINMLMFFFKKKLPGIFCLASNKSYSFFYIANLIKKLLPGILIKFQQNNSKITKRFFRDLYFFKVNKNYHCAEIKNGIKKTLNK
jgi:UDP-glucose 4-epimerase